MLMLSSDMIEMVERNPKDVLFSYLTNIEDNKNKKNTTSFVMGTPQLIPSTINYRLSRNKIQTLLYKMEILSQVVSD